jgi:hypothetical protein
LRDPQTFQRMRNGLEAAGQLFSKQLTETEEASPDTAKLQELGGLGYGGGD